MMQTAKADKSVNAHAAEWSSEQMEFQRMAETVALICRHLGIPCSLDSWMKDVTTIGVGGPILAIAFPKNARSALQLVQRLNQEEIAWSPLGMGTNLLAMDKPQRRVAISLRQFYGTPSIEGPVVQVPAGLSLPALVSVTAELGLSGLEGLSGLSGSVGGAIKRNVSAYGCEIGAVTRSVTVLCNDGVHTLRQEEVGFEHGHSALGDQQMVLTAAFQLVRGDRARMTRTIARYRKAHLDHRPLTERCLGGVFKNPPLQSAGRLIDELQLKGLSRGGAVISEKHANYIVNRGQATAADVLELIEAVRYAVMSLRRIDLQLGVTIWS
ncbi:MAG: UDP-N-acetylmuramate dehydrogenase [Acidobacteriota bacterium]|nr:UDP-N-acetylmuramate dehydrogenase [Blastocatellia bacterium]MDW8238073.1 UDP-N-acetylmuramate dehydrogenase [Acidobacteriota bacterium]